MFKKLIVNIMGRPQYATPLLKANNLGTRIKYLSLDKCLCMTQTKKRQQLKLLEANNSSKFASLCSPS